MKQKEIKIIYRYELKISKGNYTQNRLRHVSVHVAQNRLRRVCEYIYTMFLVIDCVCKIDYNINIIDYYQS